MRMRANKNKGKKPFSSNEGKEKERNKNKMNKTQRDEKFCFISRDEKGKKKKESIVKASVSFPFCSFCLLHLQLSSLL